MRGASGAELATWTLADYSGSVRRLVLGWKSGRRPDLATPVCSLATSAAAALAPLLADSDTPSARPVLVVPAPSGRSRRRRGRFVVADLADAFARGLALAGRQVAVADVLRRVGTSDHHLNAAARSTERMRHIQSLVAVPGTVMTLLVDDVVTTGATLAACATKLTVSGADVVGAFTLAATAPPGSRSLGSQ